MARLNKIDTGTKSWPKAANSLTRKLRPILSNLREGLGIHVVITRQTTEDSKKKKNTSIIRIRKSHPLSPSLQNYEQTLTEGSGDTLQVGDNVSTQQLMSPPEYVINHAQEALCWDIILLILNLIGYIID